MEPVLESSVNPKTLADEVQARSRVCATGLGNDRTRVFQSGRVLRNRQYRRAFAEQRDSKRLFTPEIKAHLKDWLIRRRRHPYPNRAEKRGLANETGLTYIQICNWFANWRRKLKHVAVNNVSDSVDGGKTWSHRIVTYNERAEGNVEQLSISSEDSIWKCDDSKADDATISPVFDGATSKPGEMEVDGVPCVACMDHSYSSSTPLEPQCLTVSSTTSEPEDMPHPALASLTSAISSHNTTPTCYEIAPTFHKSPSTSNKMVSTGRKSKPMGHKSTHLIHKATPASPKKISTYQKSKSMSHTKTPPCFKTTSASYTSNKSTNTNYNMTTVRHKATPTSLVTAPVSPNIAPTFYKSPSISPKTRQLRHELTSMSIKTSSKSKRHVRGEKRDTESCRKKRRNVSGGDYDTKKEEETPISLSKWLASAANFQPATSTYCIDPCKSEASWMTASRCVEERGAFSHQRAELEAAETLTRLARLHH